MKTAPAFDLARLDLLGREMYELVAELYPICRSITGNGVRETLGRLLRLIPLTIEEVPSGKRAFDWTVPPEWNIRDAYVKNSRGERVIDFQKSNLHVVSYSTPVHETMRLEELKSHLFTMPDRPGWVPYRTSYYKRSWGFCLSHNQFLALPEDEYEVRIDSTLGDGHLTYGETYLAGETTDEILVSTHICHPSLANDNLSGIAVAAFLVNHLSQTSHRYSYRFLFIPGTIGAITWLSMNEESVPRIKHGLVLAGVGDAGPLSYKKSRRGDAEIDRVCSYVLGQLEPNSKILDFSPYGYDERQYCSPGLNLPVGRLSRTPYSTFPEYHTSADDLSFVSPEALRESFSACVSIFSVLEKNRTYVNTSPKCEPQLGERGLYREVGGSANSESNEMAMLWVLNFSDGNHSLLEIAEKSNLNFDLIQRSADQLLVHRLLTERRHAPQESE